MRTRETRWIWLGCLLVLGYLVSDAPPATAGETADLFKREENNASWARLPSVSPDETILETVPPSHASRESVSLDSPGTDISGIWKGECDWASVDGTMLFLLSQNGSGVRGTWQNPDVSPTGCGPWKGAIAGTVSDDTFFFKGTSPIKDPDTCKVICRDPLQVTFTIEGDGMYGNGTERDCRSGEVLAVRCALSKIEIDVEEVAFNWGPDSGAVSLKERTGWTDVVAAVPEYIREVRNEPVAYVRGSPLSIQVKFRANRYDVGKVKIWAEGPGIGLKPEVVGFRGGQISDAIRFESTRNLSNKIARMDILWKWKYEIVGLGKATMLPTSHRIYTTWRSPISQPVYRELVSWTSEWAKGRVKAKGICDAIIQNLEKTGLKYGVPGWSTAEILDNGGGMCGGWSNMFRDMANAQGVSTVYRRCFLLQNDAALSPEEKWTGIVIKKGGLNQEEPPPAPKYWRDVDLVYPLPRYEGDQSSTDDVEYRLEKRYLFYAPYDGHCVDFLSSGGLIYLYDPSFGTGPFSGTFESVPEGSTKGVELSRFREMYHDAAIDYMEGTINCRQGSGEEYEWFDVKTKLIPDLRDPKDPSTFEIHYEWM